MLILALSMLVVQTIVTCYLSLKIMDSVMNLPACRIKIYLIKGVVHPFFAFTLNITVSASLVSITGAGLIAGIGNLGASILEALIVPMVIKMKYDVESLISEIESKKVDRASKLNRIFNRFKRTS